MALFIGHQDRIEKLNPYAKRLGIADYIFDPDDSVGKSYGITYGAGFVFIDRQGTVRDRIPKGTSPERLEAGIQKIIQ